MKNAYKFKLGRCEVTLSPINMIISAYGLTGVWVVTHNWTAVAFAYIVGVQVTLKD